MKVAIMSEEDHKLVYWRMYADDCKMCHYKPDCARYFILCPIHGKHFDEIEKCR